MTYFQIESQKKTFSQRTFAPLNQGSIRGSIFTLTATSIGAGILTIPHIFQEAGWLVVLVNILVAGFVYKFASHLIIKCCLLTNEYTWPGLCRNIGG